MQFLFSKDDFIQKSKQSQTLKPKFSRAARTQLLTYSRKNQSAQLHPSGNHLPSKIPQARSAALLRRPIKQDIEAVTESQRRSYGQSHCAHRCPGSLGGPRTHCRYFGPLGGLYNGYRHSLIIDAGLVFLLSVFAAAFIFETDVTLLVFNQIHSVVTVVVVESALVQFVVFQ